MRMKEQHFFFCLPARAACLVIAYRGVVVSLGVAALMCYGYLSADIADTFFDICIRENENMKCPCLNLNFSGGMVILLGLWAALDFFSGVMLIFGVRKEKANLAMPACLKLCLDLNLLVVMVLYMWHLTTVFLPVSFVMTFSILASMSLCFTAYSLFVLLAFYQELKRSTRHMDAILLQRSQEEKGQASLTKLEEGSEGARHFTEPMDKYMVTV